MRFKLVNKPRFVGFVWSEVIAGAAVLISLVVHLPL